MCRGYSGWGCCTGPYPYFYHHMSPFGPGMWACCHPLSREEEIEHLKNLKDILERRLHQVERRIEDIKGSEES